MKQYEEAKQISQIVANAKTIVILQADNPDADSLASALALEQILHKLGKNPHMYCGVDMPEYLRYLSGWDRVVKDLPPKFDASVIVDTSSIKLFEKLVDGGMRGWLSAKPCVVLDHHAVTGDTIDFAHAYVNDTESSSTGEVIYNLSRQLDWPLDKTSAANIMTAILGDTQGLTNDLARAATYRIMAELVELGVDRPKIEELRREYGKMDLAIYKYKAKLIERTEFTAENRIAVVSIPHAEIKEYSPLYNPAPLVQNDMLQTRGVGIAIVFKQYDGGRITAAIRSNSDYPFAANLAEYFGGGGHPHASGFKILGGKTLADIKKECIAKATELVNQSENKT